jgi:hypothetical protein
MDFLWWTQPPKRFLVWSDVIRVLLPCWECGILEEGNNDTTSIDEGCSSLSASDNSVSHHASPHPRFAQSPLMHWACRILSRTIATTTWRTRRLMQPQLQLARKPLLLDDDEFDDHDCILNIHDTMWTMPDGLSFDSVPLADDNPSVIC